MQRLMGLYTFKGASVSSTADFSSTGSLLVVSYTLFSYYNTDI